MKKWVLTIILSLTGSIALAAEPASAPAPTPATVEKPSPTAASHPKAMDRLELEATTITGNQELPKVMYVVPWKKADLGDLNGHPANSLLEEVLAPVDRDVFRREVAYFDALATNSQPAQSQAAAAEK